MIETVSVEEAGRLLGCGRSRVFDLLAAGTLERAPRYGRGLRIFRVSVDRALVPPPRASRKRRVALPEPCRREDFADLIR